jgi:fermentation-respiration switch protein FrsA (DUF1100 family)
MAVRKLRFANEAGEELVGLLDLPALGEARTAALFAHCFTCSKDQRTALDIGRAVAAGGIAVLRFDFTGLGESGGDFAGTTFSSSVADLVSAGRALAAELAPPRLLLGHSLGGSAAIAAAGRMGSVSAVATIGAPFSPGHTSALLAEARKESLARGEARVVIAGRAFTLRRSFFEDIEEARMADAVAGLRRALLVMHSPRDEVVGIENAARIFESARHPKSFVSLDTADHLLTDRRDSAYAAAVLSAWASRYI